mgnify:FL=1|tara:strand:+ start:5629 stop:6531 length:903 start_codon:yes stop_codon:yes gene_type:complete
MKMNNKEYTIGIIGGTGIYDFNQIDDAQWVDIESPFGSPSDSILIGFINGQRIAFLPRHGRGHILSPSEINYRANIDVLKRSGVTKILSFSAVGSLRKEIKPGTFVVVDQYIDRTFKRENTFFSDGFVVHVSMANPICNDLSKLVEIVGKNNNINIIRGGTYIVIEGPQFSTLSESKFYRSMGCDVIGMTNMPEAKLAREAEISYCSIAMTTDYDCWHPKHENVSTKNILDILSENSNNAQSLIKNCIKELRNDNAICSDGCNRSLDNAVCTDIKYRKKNTFNKIYNIAGRVINKDGWIK